jgi:hypothetical protein
VAAGPVSRVTSVLDGADYTPAGRPRERLFPPDRQATRFVSRANVRCTRGTRVVY